MYVIPKYTEPVVHTFITHYDKDYISTIDSNYKWTMECSCGWCAPDESSYNGKDHHLSIKSAENYYKNCHLKDVQNQDNQKENL